MNVASEYPALVLNGYVSGCDALLTEYLRCGTTQVDFLLGGLVATWFGLALCVTYHKVVRIENLVLHYPAYYRTLTHYKPLLKIA